jgi:hypothetical protein
MSDDWRLRIHVPETGRGRQLAESMEAAKLEHELAEALPDRVAVSHDEDDVFCYTATREDAERARDAAAAAAAQHGWEIETELARWHPVAEEWEDPDKPLPTTEGEQAAEHAELIQREREEVREQGYADFEVRVQCHSRGDAIELARRLEEDGIPSVRRWRYLLIGAPDEDTAAALASRISAQAPPGCVVTTEGTGRAADEVKPRNPFAIFGGLGG